MSEHKSVEDLPPKGEQFDITKVSSLLNLLLCVGVGAVALSVILALKEDWRPSFAFSWLFAFIFFFTLALGGLFWTLLHNATNSGWGVAVRRLMENLGNMLPWMAVVALPLIVVPDMRDALWEWIPKREIMLQEGDAYAKAHFEEEHGEWKHSVEEFEADFATLETELNKSKAGATEGEKAWLEEKRIVAEMELAVSKEGEPTEESVRIEGMKEHDVLLYKKGGFLNFGFWIVRFALYFFFLTLMIGVLRTWSIRQDYNGDPKFTRWARRASCGFLPLFAVTTTFAVVDWLMALDYTWFSTMWGVYLFAGSALSSMALLIVVLTFVRDKGYLQDVVTEEHYHIMGKLMHAFVIFWAYISFSQYFLIWYANITEETRFFLMRNTGQWNTVSIVLVVFHFFVPFLLLLQRGVKKNPRLLSAIGVYMLVMHVVDMYWIVIPERGPSLGKGVVAPGAFIFDIVAFVAVGAILAFVFLRSLAKESLYPCRDPRLDESINLAN